MNMDRITRYEWHGNVLLLVILSALVITIPVAVVYFMVNLLRIETEVKDGEKFSEFLRQKKVI